MLSQVFMHDSHLSLSFSLGLVQDLQSMVGSVLLVKRALHTVYEHHGCINFDHTRTRTLSFQAIDFVNKLVF